MRVILYCQHYNRGTYMKASFLYVYFFLKDFSLSAFVYISILAIINS